MGLNRSCVLLIVIAGMERFAFKGVASNLVTYLTDVEGMSNSSAAKMVSSWCGFTSMLPLLMAPLADSYWDRRSTILASSFFYIMGLLALTLTAMASESSPENKQFLFLSLCTISVGMGGYNPSLQAFGTDQLEAEVEEELQPPRSKAESGGNKKSPFFQWWYFGICTGSLLGTTVLSYVEDTFGWVIGFAIPTGAMVASTVLFCCGGKIYAVEEDSETNKRRFWWVSRVVKAAASKFMSSRSSIRLTDGEPELGDLELQGKPLCYHTNLTIRPGELKKEAGKSHVLDNAKVVLRLLPIWITLLMFAVIFQQPATFFTKQGAVMKRTVGAFKVPPATLQSAITLSIVLLMPLYDKALIPAARFFTRNEKGMDVMQRMGVGMVLSIIAMVIAAQVETKRMEMVAAGPDKAALSIFWLLPQYILLGISDVFTVVGMQEFFYSEVPLRMRTMGFALYTSVFGVGSFVSALMISIVEASTRGRQSWFTDDMNKGRLDKYYWLLALASVISLLLYMALCKVYRGQNKVEGE
ncbi:hypothetical protein SAY86_006799 [Trapa natans]|uniref:Uncharacterized protein n=1 Tax=Trapa natans TaxID=22666 RepID=A0AAN7LEH1_TRANT|nr:hypothetical protein SAY86_006799 [Trapa natans]